MMSFPLAPVGTATSSRVAFQSLTNATQSGSTPAVAGESFADALSQASSQAISNIKAGESMAIAGLQGKASTQEVVQAVLRAEQSLQTSLAIRDKVVSAYLDLTRMQI